MITTPFTTNPNGRWLSIPIPPVVSPLGTAAVLLAARLLGEPLGLELPSAKAILAAAGVTRSRAYEAAARVVDFSMRLEPRVGRRPAQTEPQPQPRDRRGGEPGGLALRDGAPGVRAGPG